MTDPAAAWREALALESSDPDRSAALVRQVVREAPEWLLDRIASEDFRSARLDLERVGAAGEGGHAIVVALAAAGDPIVQGHAVAVLAPAIPAAGLRALAAEPPRRLFSLVAFGGWMNMTVSAPGRAPHQFLPPGAEETRRDWRGRLLTAVRERPLRELVPFLPWLVPIAGLTTRDEELRSIAADTVRAIAGHDGPLEPLSVLRALLLLG